MLPTLSPASYARMAEVGSAAEGARLLPRTRILQRRMRTNRQRLNLTAKSLPSDIRLSVFAEFHTDMNSLKGGIPCLRRFLKSPISVLRKQERVFRIVESTILLSFSTIDESVKHFLKSWWRIITNKVISTSRTQPAIELWKEYTTNLKKYFLGYCHGDNSYKALFSEFPKFPEGTWMSKEPGTLTKSDLAMLMQFVTSTRAMPPGDRKKEEEALAKHERTFHTLPTPLSGEEKIKISRYAFNAGLEVKGAAESQGFYQRFDSHCSISNSSCIESSRSDGGRREFILKEFLVWLTSPHSVDVEYDAPDGSTIRFRAGTERWRTLYRPSPVPETLKWHDVAPVYDRRLHPQRVGAEDDIIAKQLWAWAFISLVDDGYINIDGSPTGKPIPLEVAVVSEPGGKSRIVTKTLAAAVTYGQPCAHIMRGFMQCDPTLYAGFGAAAQAFEYIKRLGTCPLGEVWHVMDFEEATDFISHQVANLVSDSFCEGAGISSKYLKNYLRFIAQPYLLGGYETVKGIPMGTPGSKIILHMIGKVCSMMAKGIESPRPIALLRKDTFSCAGDDVIDKVKLETSRRYAQCARYLRMKVSILKSGAYRYGGTYCEVLLREGDFDFKKQTGNINSALVDAVRVRLISPETKANKGDEDRNPIFGKAFQFSKELEWCEEYYPGFKTRAMYLFKVNFREYITESPFVYLPRDLGGLSICSSLDSVYDKLTKEVKQCLALVDSENMTLHNAALRALRSWGSKSISRGIKLDQTSSDSERERFLMEFMPLANLDTAYENLSMAGQGLPYENPRVFAKVTHILSSNYYSLQNSLEDIPPFWEPSKKANRGWPMKPFHVRDRDFNSLLSRFPGLPEITREDFNKLAAKQHVYKHLYYRDADLQVPVYGNSVTGYYGYTLNLRSRNTGASLKLGLSNFKSLRPYEIDLSNFRRSRSDSSDSRYSD